MLGNETRIYASVLKWVGFWIVYLVAVCLGVVVVCGLTVPLDGFCEWMKKLPQEPPVNTGRKFSMAGSKAGKPGSASIISNDTDLRI